MFSAGLGLPRVPVANSFPVPWRRSRTLGLGRDKVGIRAYGSVLCMFSSVYVKSFLKTTAA